MRFFSLFFLSQLFFQTLLGSDICQLLLDAHIFYQHNSNVSPFKNPEQIVRFVQQYAKKRETSTERIMESLHKAYRINLLKELFEGIPIHVKINGSMTRAKLTAFWVRDVPFFTGTIDVPQDRIVESTEFVTSAYQKLPHMKGPLRDPNFLNLLHWEDRNFFPGAAIIQITDPSGTPLAHLKIYYFDYASALENHPLGYEVIKNSITPWERYSYFETKKPFQSPLLNPEHQELFQYIQEHHDADFRALHQIKKYPDVLRLRSYPEEYVNLLNLTAIRYAQKFKQLQVGEIYRLAKNPNVKIDFDDFWYHLLFAGVVLGRKEEIPTFYMEARTAAHRDVYQFYLNTNDVFTIRSEINPESISWRIRQSSSQLLHTLVTYMKRKPEVFTPQQISTVNKMTQKNN